MVPIFLTYTRKKLDFSDLGSGTADYIAKMWYFRIYFPLQMWFFSDSGMVWYVWDMWYAIMRCILKDFTMHPMDRPKTGAVRLPAPLLYTRLYVTVRVLWDLDLVLTPG